MEIEINKELIINTLKLVANETAIRFHCPVFMVGSFLRDPYTARDIDIMIVMSRDRFLRLFKTTKFNNLQMKWRIKEKESFETHLHGWDIDIKPQMDGEFVTYDKIRLRLDCYNNFFPTPTKRKVE